MCCIDTYNGYTFDSSTTPKPPNAMTTYTITNDRYSNQADEVTFQELIAMCQENGWAADLRVRGNKVVNEAGEVVAEATAEAHS